MPPGLRPAIAPGEDRNEWTPYPSTVGYEAAPGHRAGRGSQRRATVDRWVEEQLLRPAIAPGEDRNGVALAVHAQHPVGCARPSRRARIATLDHDPIPPGDNQGCAWPSRRARIATGPAAGAGDQ